MHPPPEASSRTNRNESQAASSPVWRRGAGAGVIALLAGAPASASDPLSFAMHRVSVSPEEADVDRYRFAELPSISDLLLVDDGSGVMVDAVMVAYATNANEMIVGVDAGHMDVYRTTLFLESGLLHQEWVSSNTSMEPIFSSVLPAISDDGTRVTFMSTGGAWRFVSGVADAGNEQGRSDFDLFLWDIQAPGDSHSPVTINNAGDTMVGGSGRAISGDGKYVAFVSSAEHPALPPSEVDNSDIFRRNIDSETTELVSVNSLEDDGSPSISADGRFVAFGSKTLKADDFGGGAGPQTDPDPNGTTTDIFLADMDEPDPDSRISAVSVTDASGGDVTGNGRSALCEISQSGEFVAFVSLASDLDAETTDDNGAPNVGLPDVYLRSCPGGDCASGDSVLVSVDDATLSAPPEASGAQFTPIAIYENPTTNIVAVAFSSLAPLATDDDPPEDPKWDLFVRVMNRSNPACGETYLVSRSMNGGSARHASFSPSIAGVTAADGANTRLFIAFSSWADDLTPGDENGAKDIFVADMTVATPTCP